MRFLSSLLLMFSFCTVNAQLISSSAYLTSSVNNSTGDGTILYVPFNAVTFDDANCFNLSNGTYVAPANGTLIITGIIEIANVSSTHNTFAVVLSNMTASENRYVYAINPYYLQDTVPPSGYSQLPYCETMKCSEGDVFCVMVFVIGGSKTVNVIGGMQETRLSMNFFPS